MELFEVIGIQRLEGEYQGHKYNNFVIHTISDVPANVSGRKTATFKVRSADVETVIKGSSLEGLIGKKIYVYFNKYQQVVQINVAK